MRSFRVALYALAMLALPECTYAGTLYGATAGAHGELYILDPNSGAVLRDVGPLNDAAGRNYPMEGLAFQPHTRVLYGATHYSDTADPATVSKLVTINPETAEVTVVGSFFLGNPGTMADLAFYESGALAGIGSYGPPQIYNIDVRTGISTPVFLEGLGDLPVTEGGGIAYPYLAPTASAFGVVEPCHHGHGGCYPPPFYRTISNPEKPAGGGNYGALDFDGNVLYGLNVGLGSPPRTHLVRISTGTGAVTDIGRSVDGLAAIAYVPEPGTLALSAVGMVLFAGWIGRRFHSSQRTPTGNRWIIPFGIVCVGFLIAPNAVAVTIDWLTIGDPGEGGVAYVYRIGKYDVTVNQYVEFLNRKDPTGINTLALYRAEMSDENYGGIRLNASAAEGDKYEVIEGRGNHPANYITWYDAARFANWLHNGQGDGDTESGAYTLLGGTPTPTNSLDITRNPGARVYIPTEDEWTKAGYYLPGAQIYFQYPTSTNTPPVGSPPTGVVNRANILPGGPGTLTDVGAYTGTTSPYGAYDMWGNVIQWTDSYVGPPNPFLTRSIMGAAFDGSTGGNPGTGSGSANAAGARSRAYGFRVASVIPEPATLAIVGICLLVAGGFVRRPRLPLNMTTASAATRRVNPNHRLLAGTLVICAALIGAAAAPVHAGSIAWVHEFQTGAYHVALDTLGNVFVSGGQGVAEGIRKYDVAGNLQWTKQITTTPSEIIGGIAADRFGNIYVTGVTDVFGTADSFLTKYNPEGDLAWTRELAAADNVRSSGVSTDTAGNVYIAGTTDGSLGGPNAGLNDAFVSKYDAEGNLQWVRQLGSTASEAAHYVVADALGNVFISGSTQGSLAAPIGPVTNVYDAFVAKYDTAGNFQWTEQFNANPADFPSGIAADDLGNVYMAGRTGPYGGNYQSFVNKYDSAGALQWTRQLGIPPADTSAWDISADGLGNIFIAGSTGASLGGPSKGSPDAFVAKYDTAGKLNWTYQFGSADRDYAYSIAADGAGNLYIGGHGKLIGSGPTRDYLARYVIPEPASWLLLALASTSLLWTRRRRRRAVNRTQCAVCNVNFQRTLRQTICRCPACVSLCGGMFLAMAAPPARAQTQEWIRTFGTEFNERSNGVSADGLGNVYTASYKTYQLPSDVCVPQPWPGGQSCIDQDAVVTKFDAAGNLQWTAQLGTELNEEATAVSTDRLGNVYIAGDTFGSLAPNPGGGYSDAFLAKYGPTGNLLWTRQLGSSEWEVTNGVSADGLGNVYISGQTEGDMGGPHAGGTYDAYLGKYDNHGDLQWIRQLPDDTRSVQSSVSADPLGNVFLLGREFVAKFDGVGDLKWSQPLWGNGKGVSADDAGNVYVAGISNGFGLTDFVSKFAADGSLEWTQRVSREDRDSGNVYGVSADGHGNVYMTGYSLSGGSYDGFIRKYDESGNFYWTHYLGGDGDGTLSGRGISADGLGNIYVAGASHVNNDDNEFIAKYVEDPEQQPPVVLDRFGAAYQGELVVLKFLTPEGTAPITYHDLLVTGPNGASPVNAPMLSSTGELSWQTTISDVLGSYDFDVTATNAFGSDTGRITLHLGVPEPTSWLLMTLASAGILCIARRRKRRTEK